MECAVLGNHDAAASIVGRSALRQNSYDYDDKYINGTSQLYIPARIPDEAAEKVRETAVRVYRLLDVPVLPGLTFSSQRKITGSF